MGPSKMPSCGMYGAIGSRWVPVCRTSKDEGCMKKHDKGGKGGIKDKEIASRHNFRDGSY